VSETVERILSFVGYASSLKGDERGEAQVFLDRLFQAFGHKGYKEAGATLESRIKDGKTTRFADLLWRPRLLLEMKKRGEKLEKHYQQAFEYWIDLVPHRPRYVVLCNFDELWIYDLDSQLHEPVDRVAVTELPQRYTSLNFLFPENPPPLFGNDRIAVTRVAADKVARVFNSLIARDIDRETAQRFILQCVVAMFSEDIDLLPRGLFTGLVHEAAENGDDSADLLGGLFKQMNSQAPRAGRFKDVPYFNGGLYAHPAKVTLKKGELALLVSATAENWSKVEPGIFGTLFQGSLEKKDRHALGAHFTNEAEIQRVVLPTIVRPWQQRIKDAKTLKDLTALRKEMMSFRILDPACGSGNFLYLAYRELKRLELSLVTKVHTEFGEDSRRKTMPLSAIRTTQFFGIDIVPFAVELAKVTLMLGKKLALDEAHNVLPSGQATLPLQMESALPLDNLDKNVRCADALFCDWPEADAIIGNPPYQSKNKMQREFGADYVQRVRSQYPDVPGRADYCVYWFRRAHDELKPGGRAGLVGTNTIRQNYSREGGLDYIVQNGGTITEAVSTQVWPGQAVVHVSIVNWVKGTASGKKRLYTQDGDQIESPWSVVELDRINSALSDEVDLSGAASLKANSSSPFCFQGQTHGHEGFLLEPDEARALLAAHEKYEEVLHPFLTYDDLLELKSCPSRYVIDFHPRSLIEASTYKDLFSRVKAEVLPAREKAAREEQKRNKVVLDKNPDARVNHHHANFLKHWWLFSYPREDLIKLLGTVSRYIVCGRTGRRPVFEFMSPTIRPNDALVVFPVEDDYSFGILQSGLHRAWFVNRCSTLKRDFRYTSDTVFDSFPWPQEATNGDIRKVAAKAVELRDLRRRLMSENKVGLRDLLRTLDLPGDHELKDAHSDLDAAVREAFGMKKTEDPLTFLLQLNQALAKREEDGEAVVPPGLPNTYSGPSLVTSDCVKAPHGAQSRPSTRGRVGGA
jgi:SAM-dependent methyltransferase